jgi:hypothetical protein|tara:strand:+ start:278 stop:937 length:660 start_codon:yes stop_codon:yes gene_type:complete
MAGVFNAFLAYRFIKILTTPFDEQDAFAKGIIDDEGNVLKTSRDLKSRDEKKSFTTFHKIIFNLKKILAKFPGGKSRIASYAAAMALLKENEENLKRSDITLMEGLLIDYINLEEENYRDSIRGIHLVEEIVNTASPVALANFNADPFKPTFAGMRVFKVKPDAYTKFLKGKKKNSHWEPFLRREDSSDLRAYIKRYPTNNIVLQDEQYGTMTILHRDL